MARFLQILLAAASLVAGQSAICPNEVAIYNPQDRTQSFTNNWFLVPVPKEEVKKALQQAFPALFNLGGLNLLPVPASLNFPAGMHPVVASAGMTNDIRQDNFQIATGLMFAGSLIPYVGIGSSQTPLSVPLINYIAGVDDVTQAYVAGIIPSVVATIAGILFRIGAFIPLSSPFQSYSDGSLGINSKWAQAPNPASGPGLYSEAIDLKFVNEANQASPRYTLAQWKRIINQPWILANTASLINPKCQRSTFYFTNATAVPTFRTGNVTLGPSASVDPLTAVLQKASPDGSGFYGGVYGFTACAQNVGYGAVVPQGEDCEVAAQIVASSPGAW